MNQIDMGIALCHAVLAAEHAGKNLKAIAQTPAPVRTGFAYVLSLALLGG
ncbi:MAG: hypothetical protein LBB50_05990 [Oscillospiraceae bacterium]|jgi:hypothetical protein|nr:hypothetical protein [Oscillospiraceae bacterium]